MRAVRFISIFYLNQIWIYLNYIVSKAPSICLRPRSSIRSILLFSICNHLLRLRSVKKLIKHQRMTSFCLTLTRWWHRHIYFMKESFHHQHKYHTLGPRGGIHSCRFSKEDAQVSMRRLLCRYLNLLWISNALK